MSSFQRFSQRPVCPSFGRAISKLDGQNNCKPVQKTGSFQEKKKNLRAGAPTAHLKPRSGALMTAAYLFLQFWFWFCDVSKSALHCAQRLRMISVVNTGRCLYVKCFWRIKRRTKDRILCLWRHIKSTLVYCYRNRMPRGLFEEHFHWQITQFWRHLLLSMNVSSKAMVEILTVDTNREI